MESDQQRLERYARIALAATGTAEPHYEDPRLPASHGDVSLRLLTPSFWGCFDWHSAVHSHWALLRLLDLGVSPEIEKEIVAALDLALNPDRIITEARTVAGAPGFEVPYGMAWVLALDTGLIESRRPESSTWRRALQPLVTVAADRLRTWLDGLDSPDEAGLHSNSAFSMRLMAQWADKFEQSSLAEITNLAMTWWSHSPGRSLAAEPDTFDFLSPTLSVAELMAGLMEPPGFSRFLDGWIPNMTEELSEFEPVICPDPANGKLSHLQGLNLSRAWMLRSIAAALPSRDARIPRLMQSAADHWEVGDAAVTGEHFAGGHWLPTFALKAIDSDRMLRPLP